MYTFSELPIAEFYGRRFHSISNQEKEVVAYSERIFDVPKDVELLGTDRCLIFEKAVICGGEIWGGEIRGGVIWGGEIRGGVIRDGEIRGGVIWGGEICGGVIRDGEIRGGVIWGGEICGGVIRGGVIWGGEICGGVIRGGEICGGVIRGGVIRGGEIDYGTIEVSMLQIQGSRHYCYARFDENLTIELGIGCEKHSIAWWLENYESIGKIEDYKQYEVAEYFEYIKLFARRYAPELLKDK